jgi:glycosyltransferase 2 family protein
MKKAYVIAGGVVTFLSAFYFARAASRHWASIRDIEFGTAIISGMAAAAGLYVLTYLVSAKTWQLALRYLGASASFRTSAEIIFVSQFAKYLPGNVGHHVGRVLLAKRAGLGPQVVIGSIFIDSAMVVLAALICSLPSYTLLWLLANEHAPHASALLLGAAIMLGLACLIGWLLRKRWRDSAKGLQFAKDLINGERIPLLLRSFASYCISFVLGGLGLYLLLVSLTGSVIDREALPQVIGVYSAAWLLGFLIPGAPAGLGVREACLLIGLGPLAGSDSALIAAALLRITTTVMDGAVFFMGFLLAGRAHS